MKVLVIKTSSMGDILHTLPAITDAYKTIPDVEFDWVIEEAFTEIPTWHQSIHNVIPFAWRRWRKNILTLPFNPEWRQFRKTLQQQKYDFVIDAQGLIKSAIATKMAHGIRCGFDRKSVREPLASLVYHKKFQVEKSQHAITRIRELFALTLNYSFDKNQIDYGIKAPSLKTNLPKNYSVFVVNTSRKNKQWAIKNWRKLLEKMQAQKQTVIIPEGYKHEKQSIQAITSGFNNVIILPHGNLTTVFNLLANAQAIVSVDTGLAHLAAALNKPNITLYGPTDEHLIGTVGKNQIHLKYNDSKVEVDSEIVWSRLHPLLYQHT